MTPTVKKSTLGLAALATASLVAWQAPTAFAHGGSDDETTGGSRGNETSQLARTPHPGARSLVAEQHAQDALHRQVQRQLAAAQKAEQPAEDDSTSDDAASTDDSAAETSDDAAETSDDQGEDQAD